MIIITEESYTTCSNTTLLLHKTLHRSPNPKQTNLRTPNSHITIDADIISSSLVQRKVDATSDMCYR